IHDSSACHQNSNRNIVRKATTIRAIGRQRVEAINDRQDTGPKWNLRSFKPIGVASSIPVLMVMSDDWDDRIRELNRGQYVGTNPRMQLHPLELTRSQTTWLIQNMLRNYELA